MKLKILSEETLQDLRVNYETFKEHFYKKDDLWFEEYLNEKGRLFDSKFDFELPILDMSGNYLESDINNIKIFYDTFKDIPISLATQEKLWSSLTLLYYRDYFYYRIKGDIEKKNDNRIKSALFFQHGTKRSLFVHALARLWWVGYMTYDEENQDNPYWLTEFFCSADFSARCVVFFSSNFTSNRAITKGILKALIGLRDEGVRIKREHFVESTRFLNITGAAMVLDLLEEEEVKEMVERRLRKVFNLEETLV